MYDPPFCDSRPGLAAARTLPHVDLSPAGLTADLPQEVPGFPGNERVVNVDAPPTIRLEGVMVGHLNGIGQCDTDLTAFVDGVSDNLAIFGGEIDGGTVIPQFRRWCEGDTITFTVPILQCKAKTELHGFVSREVFAIESADVLRTNLIGCDWAGCARRRCRRRIGVLRGSSCCP